MPEGKHAAQHEKSSSNQDHRITRIEFDYDSLPAVLSQDSEQQVPENKAIAKYTCFTGVFDDGFCISYSNQPVKLNKSK